MPTRKYEGPSIDGLLDRVRREVGTDARIVRAQKVRRGGIFGFFTRELFELIVEAPSTGSAPARRGAPRSGRIPPRSGRPSTPLGRLAGSRTGGRSPRTAPGGRQKTIPPYKTASGRSAGLAPKGAAPATSSAARHDESRTGGIGGVNDLIRRRYGTDSPVVDEPIPELDPSEAIPVATDVEGDGLAVTDDEEIGTAPSAGHRTFATDDQVSRYWAYFLVPRQSERLEDGDDGRSDPVETGGTDAALHDDHDLELLENQPRSETIDARGTSRMRYVGAAQRSLLDGDGTTSRDATTPRESVGSTGAVPPRGAPAINAEEGELPGADQGEPAGTVVWHADPTVDEDAPGTEQDGHSGPAQSTAIERAPLLNGTDYLDDLSMMGTEELGMVGDAPVLPPEVIKILTRIPIAGMLPPGVVPPPGWLPDPGAASSAKGAVPGWNVWPEWRPSPAAWGAANTVARSAPGDVFASAPFVPSGLSAIGFPSALLPGREITELVSRIGEPGVDLDSVELARDLFLRAMEDILPAPEIPANAGGLVAIVGDLDDARCLAAKLAIDRGVDPAEVVIAAPAGEQEDVPAWMLIPSDEVAAKRRPRWKGKQEVTIVAVSAPLTGLDRTWARTVLEALQPDLVCGVVEATHKPEDIAAWAIDLGRIDTLAIEGGRATRTPAAILACGIPVSLIDGQEADVALWSRIVEERLAIC